MMAVFRIVLFNAFYGFSGFAKEITRCQGKNIATVLKIGLLLCWRIILQNSRLI